MVKIVGMTRLSIEVVDKLEDKVETGGDAPVYEIDDSAFFFLAACQKSQKRN